MLLALSNFIKYQSSTSSVGKWSSVWLSMDPGINKLIETLYKAKTHNTDCLNVDSQNDITLHTEWVYMVSNKLQC